MLHDLLSMISRGYPVPHVCLHSDSESDQDMVRSTVHGKYRGSQYSLKTLYAMADEAEELKVLLFLCYKSFNHVVFWASVPHSSLCLIAFYMAASNFDYIPALVSMLLFAMLMASNLTRQAAKTGWRRPRTFTECLAVIILNRDDFFPNPPISPGDGRAAQEKQDEEWVREEGEFWGMVNEAVENYKRRYEEHDKMLESIGAADDGDDDGESITKNRFGVLDPVGLVLAPVQSALLPVFTAFRIVKNVVTCTDENMWFILTLALLLLSVVLALVPWSRLLSLVARALCLLILGPQNRIFKRQIKDYFAELLLYSNDPNRAVSSAAMRKKLRSVLDVRIVQEQEARARDFKILYHGNRITKHWKFNTERLRATPEIEGSGTAEIERELKRGKGERDLMAGNQ
jgi:hypothetical protein